ncbi:prephenate dehydratase [Campylobacter devanensis]|uniref:prephenate dehydratase n=1 Tax=Campylobacter devanensis TaxID=3161138 RepID=UPI000A358098|nr:prephenate dehydratase [Campylobacter sp. P0134]
MSIDELRVGIDKIDNEILGLLNQRMEFVKKIGELKVGSNAPIYRPERERAILERLKSLPNNTLSSKAIEAIYLEIFAVSRNLELPQKVAFLGPVGTYTHQAAESRFGAMSSYTPISSIEGVFRELNNGEAKYGVVPIENNTEGAVGITLDCLRKYENVKIVAEIYMDIHHSFVSLSENLSDIKKIYSHPQGYNQCHKFLDDHNLNSIEFIPTKSTAQAAYLASQDPSSAAICSKIAAHINKVPIMFEKIEDNMANRTRFFVLSDFKNIKSSCNKTSILALTAHRPGGLVELLNMFKEGGINLTKLESRPIKQKDFKTVFYIDFEGHIDDENVEAVLKNASQNGHEITWLGSYLNQEGQE